MTKEQFLLGLPWILAISFVMLWGQSVLRGLNAAARYVSIFLWAVVRLRDRTAAVNANYWRDPKYWKAVFNFAKNNYKAGIVVGNVAWDGVIGWRKKA